MAVGLREFINLYKDAKTDWERRKGHHWWIGPMNETLEKICQSKPENTDVAEVFKQVAFVNRVYRANLELKTKHSKDPEWDVANSFVGSANSIMTQLGRLGMFNRKNLRMIVTYHEKLVKLVQRVTRTDEVSFCSKYLSFHFPSTVPIFDSKSAESARSIVASVRSRLSASIKDGTEYDHHCQRVLLLMEKLKRAIRGEPELRLVDYILYWALNNR